MSPLPAQLRIPGPSPLPDRVTAALSRPMMNHRGPHFGPLLTDCLDGGKWLLKTSDDVLLFSASGAGGMEAAIANVASPGEHLLFCTTGWFSEMWATMARVYGARVSEVRSRWGSRTDPCQLDSHLREHPSVRKVFITHNETSTGALNDVRTLAKIAKTHGCLTVVDSVSGAGCMPLDVDAWDLDIVVTSSQKGLLSPPGLTMISVSDEAMYAANEAKSPRFYFDFRRQKEAHDQLMSPTTPSLSVMYALREGLAILRHEGHERIWGRHHRVAAMIRAGLQDLGLELFADQDCRSDSVTTVRSPFASGDELGAFLEELELQEALVLASGIGPLYGEVFRIGHMGMIDDADGWEILERLSRRLRCRRR